MQNQPQHAQPDPAQHARRRADEKLDEALEATFPASDPFALMLDEDPEAPEATLPASDPCALLDEDPNSPATYASPPCFMHELDPSYLGLTPDRDRGPADPDEPDATRSKEADAD